MKQTSLKRYLRSLLALVLALVVPFNAVAATLTLPAALKTVSEQAFSGNAAVEEIVLPDGTETIESQAFMDCISLTRVVIPSSVYYIAEDAFHGVPNTLFIDAPVNSYAAKWARDHGIPTNEPELEAELVELAFWPNQYINMGGTNWVADLYVENYVLREGESLYWTVEPIGTNEGLPAQVVCDVVEDGGLFAGLHMINFTGEIGQLRLRVTVRSTMDDFLLSRDYTITVGDLPVDAPTGIAVPDEVVLLDVGETYTASAADLVFEGDGEYENAYFCVMPGDLEIFSTFEHTEDGFEVAINYPGRYSYLVSGTINGLEIFKEVYLVVGDGVSYEAYLHNDQVLHTVFAGANTDGYVGSFEVRDFELLPGETVSWSLSHDGENPDAPFQLSCGHQYNDGLGINVHANRIGTELGEATYQLTFTSNYGATFTTDITLEVVEAPENLPTGIRIPQTEYIIEAGEFVDVINSMILVDDGIVPEGAYFNRGYWGLESLPDVQEIYDGYRLTFNEEGRYQLTAFIEINNIILTKDINIIVGNPAYLVIDQAISKVYTSGSQELHLGTGYVESYEPEDGEYVSHWAFDYVSNGMNSPLSLQLIPTPNGLGASIDGTLVDDATGDFTYIIEMVTNKRVLSTELTITVAEPPADMPEDITLPQDTYSLQLGETIAFDNSDIAFVGGNVPEGANLSRFFDPEWVEALNQYGEAILSDDGFEVTFDTEGTYSVLAVAWIDNVFYTKEIYFAVGTGVVPEIRLEGDLRTDTLWLGYNENVFLGVIWLDGYTLQPDEEYTWTIAPLSDDPDQPALLDIWGEYDSGSNVHIGASVPDHTVEPTTYRLTFTAESGVELTRDFTIAVTEAPDNLPTALTVPATAYQVDVGEPLTLRREDISNTDGVIPTDAFLLKEYGMNWNDWEATENWTEEGPTFTFHYAGRYVVDARMEINNCILIQPIIVTVGDYVSSASLSVNQLFTTAYPTEWNGGPRVASVTLENYTFVSSEEYEWSLERLGTDGNPDIELDIFETYNSGRTANICVATNGTQTGPATFRVTLTTSLGLELYTDITVTLEAMPDNMPTALSLPATQYQLDIGDTLTLYSADMQIANGAIPQGAGVFKDYLFQSSDARENCVWYDDRVEFTATADARYVVTARMQINNIYVEQPIVITIGEGSQNTGYIQSHQRFTTMYPNEYGNAHLGSFGLRDYDVASADECSWSIELLGEDNNPPVVLEMSDPFNNGRDVDLFAATTDGHSGSVTYRLTCTTSAGAVSTDISLTVVPMPDDLPTALSLPATSYQVPIGETIKLYYDDIVAADGTIPQDAAVSTVYGTNGSIPGLLWYEDYLQFTAQENGRYQIHATLQINNISISQSITISAGTGTPSNVSIDGEMRFSKLYLDGQDRSYLGWYHLDNYRIADGEQYFWSLTPVGESTNLPVRLYISDEYDDGNAVDISFTGLSNVTGAVTYRLTFTSDSGVEVSKDITVEVTELPDNLPTELRIPASQYQIDVGESLFLAYEDIEAVDGELPSDANVSYEYWIHDDEGNKYWTQDGLTISYNSDGRHRLSAVLSVNNYPIKQEFIISVGTGLPENASIEGELRMDTLWLDCDENVYMGSFWLDGYRLMPDEAYSWSVDLISDDPSQSSILDVWGEYDAGNSVDIGANVPQSVLAPADYRITFRSESGIELTKDITVAVTEAPDNLPTSLTVPATSYQVDVGDSLTLLYDDIGIADGVIPEDVFVMQDYGINTSTLDVTWIPEGVTIYFNNNGRYSVDARLEINNYVVQQPILITVGDGVPENVSIDNEQLVYTAYAIENSDFWVGDCYVNGYTPMPGEEAVWTMTCLGDEETSPAKMRIGGYWDNGAEVVMYDMTGETGTVSYTVTYQAGDVEASTTITVDIVEMPDGLPTELSLPAAAYTLEEGASVALRYDDIEFADGAIPQDAHTRFDYATYPGDYNRSWTNNGLNLSFPNTGIYRVEAIGFVNNYTVRQFIIFYVGDCAPDADLVWEQEIDTIYLGGDDGCPWIASGELVDHPVYDESMVDWKLERIDEGTSTPVELVLEVHDNNRATVMYQNVQATGSVTYRLTLTTGSGFTTSRDITLTVEEMPDNLPTDFELQTLHELRTGEWREFDYTNITFTNGEVPENADVRAQLTNIIPLIRQPSFELYDSASFGVSFENEGQYVFTVIAQIGNYLIYKDVLIRVAQAEPCLEIWREYDTHYISDEVHWLGDAHLENVNFEEDGHVEWKIYSTDENPLAEVFVEPVWDNGRCAGFRMANFTGETGVLNYNIEACIDGNHTYGYELSVNIEAAPDNLPSGIDMVDEIKLAPNETLTLLPEDISFTQDGVVPEDATVFTEFYLDESFFNQPSFEWIDGGFTVAFSEEARYGFTICSSINGIDYFKPVVITVGTGVSEDMHLAVEPGFETHYINDQTQHLTSAHLINHNLFEFDDVKWTIECLDDEPLASLFLENMWNNGCDARFCMNSFTGETGTINYRLNLFVNGELLASYEGSVELAPLPDGLPSGIYVEQDEYHLDLGETFSLSDSVIRFTDDGSIPADALVRYDFHTHEFDWMDSFRWDDEINGFEVTFEEDFTCTVYAVATVNGVEFATEICLIAGDGGYAGIELFAEHIFDTHYINDQHHLLTDVHCSRQLSESDEVEWIIDCLDDEPLANLYLQNSWDNNSNARFVIGDFSGETGVVNYRVSLVVNGEFIAAHESCVELAEMPDDLPSGIRLEQEDYHVALGETFTVSIADISFTDDGIIPEDAAVHYELHTHELDWMDGFHWIDDIDGFEITFDENGRYAFYAVAHINGVEYMKEIILTAGTGVSDDMHLVSEQFFATHYITDQDQLLADLHLRGQNLYASDDVEWKVECLDEEPLAQLYVDNTWDDGRNVRLRINSFTGETGPFNYRVRLYANDELLISHEDCVQIEEMPDDLPSGVCMPYDEVWMDIGETFVATTDEISFTDDGVIPDGADLYFEFHTYHFDWMGSFSHLEDADGFEVIFEESGRFPFYAVGCINGVEFGKEIRLLAGDGYSPYAFMELDQRFTTAYAAETDWSDVVIGSVYLSDYPIFEEDYVDWSINRCDDNESNPVSLALEFPGDPGWANIIATDFTGETGSVTYLIEASTPQGFYDAREITLDVVDMPQNLPTQLLLPEEYEETMYFNVGDEFIFDEYDLAFSDDGVVPEDATVFYDCYENTRDVFYDQDIGWGVNGGFMVSFQREGRYELTLSVLINTYRLSRTVHIVVGDGVNDDVCIELDHQITPLYLGGEEIIVGTIRVQNFNLFEGEYIQWDYQPVDSGETAVPLLSIDEEGYWDGTYGIRVTDFNEVGDTTYVITATLPTGDTLDHEFTLSVQPMPDNLPERLVLPEESYRLFASDELFIHTDEFWFDGGDIPEDANIRFSVRDGSFGDESENELYIEWFTDDEDREIVRITASAAGEYTIVVSGWINNYLLTQSVPVTFVQGGSIAILTNDEMQNAEMFAGAVRAADDLGWNRVHIHIYSEEYMDDAEGNADFIEDLAMDLNVEAIIVSPAAPGTAEGMRRVAEAREDVLLIACTPEEDEAELAAAADIVLAYDEAEAQADSIIDKCAEWGVDVLVHFSFPRHMNVERIKARHDLIAQKAEAAGIQLIDAEFADTTNGMEEARVSITEQTYALAEEYSDQKIAFFATNCGVQSVLQRTVMDLRNAYYPQPCCPSPFHGFGESLGLGFDLFHPEDAVDQIASALNEHEAAGRFSTLPYPAGMALLRVAAEYGMAFAEDRVTERCDEEIIRDMFDTLIGSSDVSSPDDNNLYNVLFAPLNLTDYVPDLSKTLRLWVSEAIHQTTEEALEAFQGMYGYTDWNIIVEDKGEGDVADAILEGDTSADLFIFAQDQLARLATADHLAPLSEQDAQEISETQDEGAVAAVQFNDTFYAYPITSDNGYFLYYDSNVVSDPSSLESILADCEAAGKTMNMEITSGWYQPAFFFGAGCELNYTFDADGSIIGCQADYASEEGLKALKALMALEQSPSFENVSVAYDAHDIGAIVTGTWDASILQEQLGDGYAAVKLPTVGGFQLGGFGGFKMLGIKPQQTEERMAACEELARFLSCATCQAARFNDVGWGPSDKTVQQSEAVQSNIALSALADQLQYCVPQGQYPGEYWSIAEQFGRRLMAGEFSGMTDEELMAVLEAYQAELTGLAEEPIKLRWLMGTAMGKPADNDMVLEELNSISRKLIGVECEILYLTEQQMQTYLAAGEDFDICFTCDWFNNTNTMISNGLLADISDVIRTAAPKLYASLPTEAWRLASEVDGSLYAVPVLKDYAAMNFITYPSEIAEELGFDIPDQISDWSELTPFLEAWKATLPEDEYPVLLGGSARGLDSSFDFIDRTAMIGCLYGSDEVVTIFDDPVIMEHLLTLADWYQKGLINPDAPNITENSIDTSKLRINMVQAWPGYDYSPSNGYPTGMTLYAGPNVNRAGVCGAMNGLSCWLEGDEDRLNAALKYLELCCTNQLFMDTMRYGVQGYHWNYVTAEESEACAGTVLRTDKGSSGYVPWAFSQPAYFLTSMAVSMDQVNGTAKAPVMDQYQQYYDAVHENGVASALGSFTWNSTGFEDELAEITAIKDEYYSDFATGAVSIEDVYDEFIAKLNEAGLQEMIASAQAQLDAYLGN